MCACVHTVHPCCMCACMNCVHVCACVCTLWCTCACMYCACLCSCARVCVCRWGPVNLEQTGPSRCSFCLSGPRLAMGWGGDHAGKSPKWKCCGQLRPEPRADPRATVRPEGLGPFKYYECSDWRRLPSSKGTHVPGTSQPWNFKGLCPSHSHPRLSKCLGQTPAQTHQNTWGGLTSHPKGLELSQG